MLEWLVIGLFGIYLGKLSRQLSVLHKSYKNVVLLDAFNMSAKNANIKDFCDTHNLHNFAKKGQFSSKEFI